MNKETAKLIERVAELEAQLEALSDDLVTRETEVDKHKRRAARLAIRAGAERDKAVHILDTIRAVNEYRNGLHGEWCQFAQEDEWAGIQANNLCVCGQAAIDAILRDIDEPDPQPRKPWPGKVDRIGPMRVFTVGKRRG